MNDSINLYLKIFAIFLRKYDSFCLREERLKLREERIDFVRSLLSPPKSEAEIEEEDRRGRAEESSGKREKAGIDRCFLYDQFTDGC